MIEIYAEILSFAKQNEKLKLLSKFLMLDKFTNTLMKNNISYFRKAIGKNIIFKNSLPYNDWICDIEKLTLLNNVDLINIIKFKKIENLIIFNVYHNCGYVSCNNDTLKCISSNNIKMDNIKQLTLYYYAISNIDVSIFPKLEKLILVNPYLNDDNNTVAKNNISNVEFIVNSHFKPCNKLIVNLINSFANVKQVIIDKSYGLHGLNKNINVVYSNSDGQ